MRVLIADDEAPARTRLLRILQREVDLEVIGCATHGRDAMELLSEHRPDLALLDIEMPGYSGLEIAQMHSDATVIFTTAHPRFAVAAFDLGACDFLLKPLEIPRLQTALGRARQRVHRRAEPHFDKAILVSHRGKTIRVDARTVTRFWSDEKYTLFRCDGQEHILRESLDGLSERLHTLGFMRVHRSELLRVSAVCEVHPQGSAAQVVLDDGQTAQVSRRSLPLLRAELAKHALV